jgi:hypothetical protein
MVSNNPLMTTESPIATSNRGMTEPVHTFTGGTTEPRLPTPQWRSIFAGVFVALSMLAVLSILGVAIGATAYGYSTDTRFWGAGAVAWALLSAIVAFGLGGFIAGRIIWGPMKSAPFHGFLVWAVTIPILGLAAATGLGSLSAGASTNMMWTPTYAERMDTGRLVTQDLNRNDLRDTNDTARSAQEEVREATMKAAWGTFITLLLGMGAATLGGLLGGKGLPKEKEMVHS